MEFRVEQIDKKVLIGMNLVMSYIDNKTPQLWQGFMPHRNKVGHRVSNKFYSMQLYSDVFDFKTFDPSKPFTKWAAVEVDKIENMPSQMETYSLEGGLYAVFNHIGPASTFPKSMAYIFGEWMPQSDYKVDDRPHFEVLEEGYNPMDEGAREEIWIPIKKR